MTTRVFFDRGVGVHHAREEQERRAKLLLRTPFRSVSRWTEPHLLDMDDDWFERPVSAREQTMAVIASDNAMRSLRAAQKRPARRT